MKQNDPSYREVKGVDHSGTITFQVISGVPEPDKPPIQIEQPKQLSSGDD